MRRIDIIRKHLKAIDDLAQIGAIEPNFIQLEQVYQARKEQGLTEAKTAEKFKCSKRTVSRYMNYLNTEI